MKNIEAAKQVLPFDGWKVDDMSGRQFQPGDRAALIELGRNDECFTWEREHKGDEYFSSLLSFRLDHYAQFGFGVHGVWIGDVLVGQFGLQVLDDNLDRVELVVFLGQGFKRKGRGMRLTSFAVSRAQAAGMSALYGLVRATNSEGLGLMAKLGWDFVGTVQHFNLMARMYRLYL